VRRESPLAIMRESIRTAVLSLSLLHLPGVLKSIADKNRISAYRNKHSFVAELDYQVDQRLICSQLLTASVDGC